MVKAEKLIHLKIVAGVRTFELLKRRAWVDLVASKV
jgi:hypothetical protein